ncbi:hypothetical protein D9M68_912430 [compost metagenome]
MARRNWLQAKAACIVPEKEGASQVTSGESDPALINEQLDWTILRLVAHFSAVFDPVAEVDRIQPQPRRLLDLPKNGETSKTAPLLAGLVKGINR